VLSVFIMNQTKKTVVIFIVAVLLFSALGHGLWASTVFCLSKPDHAAFEPGQNGRCHPSTGESGRSHSFDEISSATGCDSCLDMPVSGDNYYRQQSGGGLGIPSLSFGTQVLVSDACINSIPLKNTTVFPSPSLLSLRTQVLLI